MRIEKISYSESAKMTTGIRFESRLVSFSADATINESENKEQAALQLKEFVKSELKKELTNAKGAK